MLNETRTESGMRIWHARPDDAITPRPVVLLLHERYGPVEHSFNVLERFAKSGFVAAMPDLFHRYKGNRGEVERAETRVDVTDAESITDIDVTLAYLRSLPYVDGTQVGISGFCLSGRTPIVYAAARPGDVSAISITHGGIYPRDYNGEKPGQAIVGSLISQIQCPVLGMFGEIDRSVPMENIRRFRSELERTGANYWIKVFADTPHGWMNTTNPAIFRETPSEAAWVTLAAFYAGIFAGDWSKGVRTWRFEPDSALIHDFSC
jgi:carboxymethylenebutenolidase